jgi:small subunit ribosomal protein S16
MLRIRLSRTGKKRQRDGCVVERIGHYNPLPNPAVYDIKEDRALYWLSVGAQPSDAVRVLLNKQGTLDRLARYHAGESLEALVAEYQGVATETVATESVAAPVGVAETAAVATPVVAVAEEIEEAISAALDTDEEE